MPKPIRKYYTSPLHKYLNGRGMNGSFCTDADGLMSYFGHITQCGTLFHQTHGVQQKDGLWLPRTLAIMEEKTSDFGVERWRPWVASDIGQYQAMLGLAIQAKLAAWVVYYNVEEILDDTRMAFYRLKKLVGPRMVHYTGGIRTAKQFFDQAPGILSGRIDDPGYSSVSNEGIYVRNEWDPKDVGPVVKIEIRPTTIQPPAPQP